MKRKLFSLRWLWVSAIGVQLLLLSQPAQAKYIGAEPPCPCRTCGLPTVSEPSATGSTVSRTQGNLSENILGPVLRSASGPTAILSYLYNSYNADGSRAQVDTVMGYGWTHSYNIFLFRQVGSMFRFDGEGHVTKYKLGPGGTFTAAAGYFETLVRNPDGSFTLTQKDKTAFTFASIPNTPFLVGGPVWRLTEIVDRNGNTTTLTYTGGNLTSITDTYGRKIILTYNGQNKIDSVNDPAGRVWTFQYDSTGRKLVEITDPNGDSIQYSYNFLYQLTDKVDRDGRTFSYIYVNNEPVTVQDSDGTARATFSNLNNWATDSTALAMNQIRTYLPSTTSNTDSHGKVGQYQYDANGYLTGTLAPDGATTTYTYDPATLMVSSTTDANGHTTSYKYDSNGNLIQKIDANGNVTTYTYESVFNQMTSMTDPNGRVTTYTLDPSTGNRTKETDPLLQTRQWTYDSHGNVLTETDKRGITSAYVYDTSGNRITATDAVGTPDQRQTTFTYDAVGNLLTRTDANGHTTSYFYDGLDRVIEEEDPVGKFTQTFYDGEGNRIQVIDRNGNSTFYEYDLRKRPITAIDVLGQTTTQRYDGNDNRTAMTDKNGHTTTYDYDVQDRLIRTTDAVGNTSTMTFDGVGNQVTGTDANNHTTTYTFDALNRLATRTDAEGFVNRYTYDIGAMVCADCTGPTKGSNLATKQTDGNGKVTYFKYDGLDRLIIQIRKEGDTADVIDASDAVTEYFYDPNNNRLQVIEPNGNATVYQYDALNRRTLEMNTAGDTTLRTYDSVNNLKTFTTPTLNVTAYSYDALDRVFQVDDSVGRVGNYTYDPVGNRLTEKDGNGNGTTNAYDPIYRLTDVTDALGRTTHYDYDPVGNLLKLTDRQGNITTYIYDNINRRIQMTDALGDSTGYQYDGVGNLTRLIDAKGQDTDYAYDRINRPIKETYADGRMRDFAYDAVNLTSRTDQKGQTTNYIYNDLYFLTQRSYPVSSPDNMAYDLSGRMQTAERGGWRVTFQYDGANRITQTTQNGQVIDYAYNIPGRTRTVTYPGGRVITEEMDFRSRLDHIGDGLLPPIVEYTYDLGNRISSRTYRNGVQASYTYNSNDWMLELEHSSGTTRIAGFGYVLMDGSPGYDKEGNKAFEEKRPDSANSDKKSEAYQYDTIYRLIDFKVGTLVGSTVPVPLTQTQYSLDPVGNWNMKTTDGVTENRTYSVTNEITQIGGVPVLSDFNGNTSEDGQYRYAYDEENRLTSVTRKSDNRVVGQYQYDALSRRVAKTANPAGSPTETRYFYDDARIIEEQDTSGVTEATYVYGDYIDEVLTMDRGGQTFFYHQNSLWSGEAITDRLADVVERYSYDTYGLPTVTNGSGVPVLPNSWGTVHSAIGNPWMFTGRQFDEETGIYYYRARYHDPVKGRFLQRDPLGYVGGENQYIYAGNNPEIATDPLGLDILINGKAIPDEMLDKLKKDFPQFSATLNGMKAFGKDFQYDSQQEITRDFAMRAEFIKCLEDANKEKSGLSYPRSVGDLKDAKFTAPAAWTVTNVGGPLFVYKGGPNPAQAIKELVKGPTTLDCTTANALCLWHAFLTAIGPTEFNDRFKDKKIEIGFLANGINIHPGPWKVTKQPSGLPGDWFTFWNNQNYRQEHPGGFWQSENTVCCKYDLNKLNEAEFLGFGTSKKTIEQMRNKLLEEFNKGLKDENKIKINDIPRFPQYQYSPNPEYGK